MSEPTKSTPEPPSGNPEDLPPEEDLATSSVIGFVLVPAMLVIAIVGVVWVFWYLTYNPYSVQDYTRLLKSDNKSTRWQAALDMVETNRVSGELVPILVEMAHAKDEDQSVVDTTQFDVRNLLKSPEEKKVNLRWYAVAALAKVGGERAYETVLEMAKDDDIGVRFYAVHGLGRMGNKGAIPTLIDRLLTDTDFGVRAASAWALGELGDKSAKDALLQAFKNDKEKDVRWNSALSLARFSEGSVEETLIEMTKADNAHTRDQARRALMMIRNPASK